MMADLAPAYASGPALAYAKFRLARSFGGGFRSGAGRRGAGRSGAGRVHGALALQDHDRAVQRLGDLREVGRGGAAPAGLDLPHELLGNPDLVGEGPLGQAGLLPRPGDRLRLLVEPARSAAGAGRHTEKLARSGA